MKPASRVTPASPAAIEAAAADWIARRDAGLTPAETAELQAWREADPRHAAAWDSLDETWSALNAPRLAGRGEVVLREARTLGSIHRRRRRSRLALVTAGAVAVSAVLFALRPVSDVAPASAASATTVVVRPDRQTLADGSIVELAGGAQIDLAFSSATRRVRLVRGEALFTVAKDAARPFVVSVGAVDVRAVGTEFAVRFTPREVAVIVTEGRVTVTHETTPDATLVDAGHAMMVPAKASLAASEAPQLQAISTDEIARALAWRTRRVEFNATPLVEAVALMNRQNSLKLTLADEATAALRITGVFWTDDPEGFARLVDSSLGLKSSRTSGGVIVLGR